MRKEEVSKGRVEKFLVLLHNIEMSVARLNKIARFMTWITENYDMEVFVSINAIENQQ